MTALTADNVLTRRGSSGRDEFGYPVAPGEKVFRGSLIGLNASGQVQRLQTAGTVVFLGLADRQLDNSASAAASTVSVVGLHGTWNVMVPSAVFTNIGAAVYGVDDGTVTLTQASSELQVGTIAGFDNGQTFVKLSGS